MTFAASLIPGLDEFVKHGDPKRRAEAARRIAELFLLGAANFRPDHVDLFDGVLIDLVPHTELAALPRILRAGEFRAPDAFDGGAGGDFLANSPIGLMAKL